ILKNLITYMIAKVAACMPVIMAEIPFGRQSHRMSRHGRRCADAFGREGREIGSLEKGNGIRR
ncbi:hypothetical protein HFY51_001839, partial [Neisseria gonorrhoeae]